MPPRAAAEAAAAAGGDRRKKLDYATREKMGVVSHFVQGMEVGAKGLL